MECSGGPICKASEKENEKAGSDCRKEGLVKLAIIAQIQP